MLSPDDKPNHPELSASPAGPISDYFDMLRPQFTEAPAVDAYGREYLKQIELKLASYADIDLLVNTFEAAGVRFSRDTILQICECLTASASMQQLEETIFQAAKEFINQQPDEHFANQTEALFLSKNVSSLHETIDAQLLSNKFRPLHELRLAMAAECGCDVIMHYNYDSMLGSFRTGFFIKHGPNESGLSPNCTEMPGILLERERPTDSNGVGTALHTFDFPVALHVRVITDYFTYANLKLMKDSHAGPDADQT